MKIKDYKKLLDINVIKAIKKNDETALNTLCKHYEKLINVYCIKIKFDENGNSYYFLDEDKCQEIKKGIFSAARKFRI